jgi:hypothetical protein
MRYPGRARGCGNLQYSTNERTQPFPPSSCVCVVKLCVFENCEQAGLAGGFSRNGHFEFLVRHTNLLMINSAAADYPVAQLLARMRAMPSRCLREEIPVQRRAA